MSGQGLKRRADIMATVDSAYSGKPIQPAAPAPAKTPEQVRSDFIRGSGPKTRGPMRRGY